jgi:hypothetical protein
MVKTFFQKLSLGVALLCAPMTANAIVIDFNDITGTGLRNISVVYEEEGIIFSDNTGANLIAVLLGAPGYGGSPSLATGISPRLNLGGGARFDRPFSLISVDINGISNNASLRELFVEINGINSITRNTFQTLFSIDNDINTFQTLRLSNGLLDFHSININRFFDGTFIVDNIVISRPNEIPTSISEPSSLALLGTGLIGFGLLLQRRQRYGAKNQHGS